MQRWEYAIVVWNAEVTIRVGFSHDTSEIASQFEAVFVKEYKGRVKMPKNYSTFEGYGLSGSVGRLGVLRFLGDNGWELVSSDYIVGDYLKRPLDTSNGPRADA